MPVGDLGKLGCCGGDVCYAMIIANVVDNRAVPWGGSNNLPVGIGGYPLPTDPYLKPADVTAFIARLIAECQAMVNCSPSTPGAQRREKEYKFEAIGEMFSSYTRATEVTYDPVPVVMRELEWSESVISDGTIAHTCNAEPFGSGVVWDMSPYYGQNLGDPFAMSNWTIQVRCQAIDVDDELLCRFTIIFGWHENHAPACEYMEMVGFKKIPIPDYTFDQYMDRTTLGSSGLGVGWGPTPGTYDGQRMEFHRYYARATSGDIFPGYGWSVGGGATQAAPSCCLFQPFSQLVGEDGTITIGDDGTIIIE